MPNFYFDIETTGLKPDRDKIITIQYQKLDKNTCEPIGELIILKEWESSEKEILEKFLRDTRIADDYAFTFVPVGRNLGFEHKFLKARLAIHGLIAVDILNKPFIDLHSCVVIMNDGEFKGSGLDNITGKSRDGSVIPKWYAAKEYDKIIEYIKQEAEEFIKFVIWLYKELPECLKKYQIK